MRFGEESNCFQLLELQYEVQNNQQVLKPVLNESDLVRFCDDNGSEDRTMSNSELDDAIRQILTKESNQEMKILSFFGKKSQIKARFQELNIWPSLNAQEQGVYGIRYDSHVLMLFSWLNEMYFKKEYIRDTATQVLRLMTCVSEKVVCCISEKELQQVDEIMKNASDSTVWEECSVKLQVEQRRDEEDRIVAEKVMDEHIESRLGAKLSLIKGSDAAILRESVAPSKKKTKKTVLCDKTYAEILQLLNEKSETFEIKFAENLSQDLKKGFLKAAEMWPEYELKILEEDFEQQTMALRRVIQNEMNPMKTELLSLAEVFFSAPVSSESKTKALGKLGEIVKHLKATGVPEHLLQHLLTPTRLQNCIEDLEELYVRGFIELYKQNLELLKGGCRPVHTYDMTKRVWGWFTSTGKKSKLEFTEQLKVDLPDLRTAWQSSLDAVECLYIKDRLRVRQKEMHSEMEKQEHMVVKRSWNRLCEIFSSTHELSLSVHGTTSLKRGWNSATSCRRFIFAEEYFTKCEAMYEFRCFGATAFSRWHRFQMPKSDDTRIFFTINPNTLLIVSISDRSTKLEKITVPDLFYCSTPTVQHIATFPNAAQHCDFNFKDRTIVFTFGYAKDLTAAVYRFDEHCKALERMKIVDLGVKCSLLSPLRSISLTNGTDNNRLLFLVDEGGYTQTLSLTSNRASEKVEWSQTMTTTCGPLFLHENQLVGFVSPENSHVTTQIVANQRLLPEFDVEFPPSSSNDNFSAVNSGNIVYILNETTGCVYGLELHIQVLTESFHISRKINTNVKETLGTKDHWLWIWFDVYEKFPVRGVLGNLDASVHLSLLGPSRFSIKDKFAACLGQFMEAVMRELCSLRKPLYELDLVSNIELYWGGDHFVAGLSDLIDAIEPTRVVDFAREMISFVPIQICRAEHNTLLVSTSCDDESYIDAAQLAASIRLGYLAPLLESWTQRCIVVSSMGKQSTGKSYFLNHLTGSSFAISGARCTDGAWMTVRVIKDILLVILDFEGLGSFERSEQEDVFLSVLNAAVSHFTVFRIEMRYDKSIDELFQKFQRGAQLIKGDQRLYRGGLFFNVKDVNGSDQRTVNGEFTTKLENVLRDNKENNFISNMYGGNVSVICSPPLGTSGYYQSLTGASREIESLSQNPREGYKTGKEFLNCIRLVMAKINMLDWQSMDESAMAFFLNSVRTKLPGIIRHGAHVPLDLVMEDEIPQSALESLKTDNGQHILVSFDELCEKYPDHAESWLEMQQNLADVTLADEQMDLDISFNSDGSLVLEKVETMFNQWFTRYSHWRSGDGFDSKLRKGVEKGFDAFLRFIILRRKERVMKWVTLKLANRQPDEIRSVEAKMREIDFVYQRCQRDCESCQLGCLKPLNHVGPHDCSTTHTCTGLCECCVEAALIETDELDEECKLDNIPPCSKKAGHSGMCECEGMDHSCGKGCVLDAASNCEKLCALKIGHAGEHLCAVLQHNCGAQCSVVSCQGNCILNFENQHTIHKCVEIRCPQQCKMDGCMQTCDCKDHFHGNEKQSAMFRFENNIAEIPEWEGPEGIHMCTNSHPCEEECESNGTCQIKVQLKNSLKTFNGVRDTFQYAYREMNGSRKKCKNTLPPFVESHEGKHCCVAAGDSIHCCDVRCPCCNYYCDKEYGHPGLHHASHGNMRNMIFCSEVWDFEVEGRKYRAGESCIAEMCNLYCSRSGRGHFHLETCEQGRGTRCVYRGYLDGRRHCQKKYLPRPKKELDEILHEQYWVLHAWEDPCTSRAEQKEFKNAAPNANKGMSGRKNVTAV